MKKKSETISILGKPYSIRWTDDTLTGGGAIMGAANRTEQTIVLNKQVGRDQMRDTLMHEVIHIISGELSLELAEETVSRLAVGLYASGVRPPRITQVRK